MRYTRSTMTIAQHLAAVVHAGLGRGSVRHAAVPLPKHTGSVTQGQQVTQHDSCNQHYVLCCPTSLQMAPSRLGPGAASYSLLGVLQRSRRNLQIQARDLNAVEKGIRGYQYNASGAVKKGWALQPLKNFCCISFMYTSFTFMYNKFSVYCHCSC